MSQEQEQQDQSAVLTEQFLTSSVDVKEKFFFISAEKKLKPAGNAMAVCASKKLIALVLGDGVRGGEGGKTVGLYSFSSSSSSSSSEKFDFKLLQVFENCEIKIFYLFFSTCSRFLLCTGETSEEADFLMLDLEQGERKEEEYEMRPVKINLKGYNKFNYTMVIHTNNNDSLLACSLTSGHGTPLGGIAILKPTTTTATKRVEKEKEGKSITFKLISYLDQINQEKDITNEFCNSAAFSPSDENLLAFGFGRACKVVNLDKLLQQEEEEQETEGEEEKTKGEENLIAEFSCEEGTMFTTCCVAWPQSDLLVFGVRDCLYLASVSRKCVNKKIQLRESWQRGTLSTFDHPFRSSSIVCFQASNFREQKVNILFFDVGKERVVHHIGTQKTLEDKESSKSEMIVYFSAFLNNSSLLCSGTTKATIMSVPALICFKDVPSFSWNERKKIWLVREKGNEKNVAIVRVLREIYVVCQLVCLFV